MTEQIVRVEKHFRHPPERVFDAFLDPAHVGEWLFRTPGGVMERTDYDPRVGGVFLIAERRGEELAEHHGRFVEIDRPRRVVFGFRYADNDPVRITVTFASAPDGGCDLVLEHVLSPEWADFAERSAKGWTMILNNFDAVVERTA